ncbi:predicted protein [Naegleria gruberi]|uniref:Predicted protein n=1 Tax=Naegleria gruberi TaxID=5762 RepID=D2V1J6_NAEGR|nr:uncharacterized protein NAEGRDRAFT_62603 [Naegleria gruberi]EFC49173.1 predicted protein [Naegleria gruberi]|eukprot:XP_002681917.1 predicted protein [Naegleria gruberi strain NEG-M]
MKLVSDDDFQIGRRSRTLRLGEKLVDEFMESRRNKSLEYDLELIFKEGYLIPSEIWEFIQQDLERIFACLRAPRNIDTSFELAVEVRNDIDVLKSICEFYNISALINSKNPEEEEDVNQLKNLIVKLEEECELFEISEKIRELDMRLINLSNTDGGNREVDDSEERGDDIFIKLEKPRIIIKIVDLLERRFNLLKRMNKIQDANSDLNKAISLLTYHIQQIELGNHYEGDTSLSRVKFWLNHLSEQLIK